MNGRVDELLNSLYLAHKGIKDGLLYWKERETNERLKKELETEKKEKESLFQKIKRVMVFLGSRVGNENIGYGNILDILGLCTKEVGGWIEDPAMQKFLHPTSNRTREDYK